MKRVILLGDKTTHNGTVITASSKMLINGQKVALVGDLVICPQKGHGVNKIITGANYFYLLGRPVAVDTSISECGCRLIASQSSCLVI